MAYGKRYFFTFNSLDTGDTPDQGDSYICEIHQKDYAGGATQILKQRNPVVIEYPNSAKNKLESLRGSRAVLRLIATELFGLADLYSEDERTWLLKVFRKESVQNHTITWSLNETPTEGFVDVNLQVWVNGVTVVDQFTNGSGSFQINKGDTIKAIAYTLVSWPAGHPGMNLEVSTRPTLRTVVNSASLEQEFTPGEDITIAAYGTLSSTDYMAIRSAVFTTDCSGGTGTQITFTKTYSSNTSQSSAQALADADAGFNTEGQNNANDNGTCLPGSALLWTGFVLPDLCEEEFTFAPYALDVNAVDGIGILKNLNFVQENGLHFTGKMSFKDVIWNCLNRLQIPDMILNTSVNIYYGGLTPDAITDPLAEAYVNTERYFKDEDLTPMTCDEVLKSVLSEWTACIVQMNGHWYVYRPNEVAVSGSILFRQYSPVDGSFMGTETLSLDKTLGGSSEGEIIYHTDRSQRKSIARPFKNATISYKYGLLNSVLENPTLAGASQADPGDPIGPRDDISIPGWTKHGVVYNGITLDGSVIFYKTTPHDSNNYFENDESITIEAGQQLQTNLTYESIPFLTMTDMMFGIELFDGTDTWYLQANGQGGYSWSQTGVQAISIRSNMGSSSTEFVSEPTPVAGIITFKIFPPENTSGDIVFFKVDAVKYNANDPQVGEIHIAEQSGLYSFVPEITNVFNGDGTTDLYKGTIYENDEDTPAGDWIRRGIPESPLSQPFQSSKPFLRIAAEEILRLHQRPMSVYDGTIAGYFPYLTRFTINDLPGVFLPVQLSYNLQEATIEATLCEVSNDEIENNYELQPDYGSVTKVSINGI